MGFFAYDEPGTDQKVTPDVTEGSSYTYESGQIAPEDPIGNIAAATGPLAYVNPFRFSNKYWDDETGLGYWGYRYCSPRLARWLSRDPMEEEGGFNLQSFVRNNPICYVDSAGDTVLVVVEATKVTEVWAFIYRRDYLCFADSSGLYSWHPFLTRTLLGAVMPWLRLEQRVKHTIEKTWVLPFIGHAVGVLTGSDAATLLGQLISNPNTTTVNVGALSTTQVIPLPDFKNLGGCNCTAAGNMDSADEMDLTFKDMGETGAVATVPP